MRNTRGLYRLWLALTLLGLPACAIAADRPPDTSQPAANHLANEKSPYLRQDARDPVEWYPWGQEAFDKAVKENKPIFLSIGYSTCHWCHVMQRESFENPAIAKLINQYFVAIKVDREERPDVDAVYMKFVTALTGEGGWPMTVFLTPDLKPFFGGTYFPPDDRDGMAGLKRILPSVHAAWTAKHDKVLSSADQLTQKLQESAAMMRAGQLQPVILDQAYESFRSDFDVHQGGFGTAPKFPRPVVLNFLFHYFNRTGEPIARDMALQTLRAMATGGIHDQIGGGFHRYSTDDRWFLPHFEKMLYDQAQLADSYLDAYQITHDPFYASTARDILDYVLRDLTGPDGQFWSAQDADSAADASKPRDKIEGAFYVWTADQIKSLLGGADAAIFDYRFGAQDGGNVEHDLRGDFKGKNVLFLAHSIPETAKQFDKSPEQITQTLDSARAKLLEARNLRPHPFLDDQTLAGWNGLMISAMARGGAILDEPRYVRAAQRGAEFIQSHLYHPDTKQISRRWPTGAGQAPGFLDDYAFYIAGLLDLYQTTFDVRWFKLARDLQHTQDQLFYDAQGGGYFQSPGQDPHVLIRLKESDDSAEPAGNSVAALNLLRLGQIFDDKDLTDRSGKTLDAFASGINAAITSMPRMLVALDFRLDPPRQIVLAGALDSPDTRAMLKEIHQRYLPNTIVLLADAGDGQKFLADRLPMIASMTPVDHRTAVYVCENFACQLPTADPAKLAALLDAARKSPTTKP